MLPVPASLIGLSTEPPVISISKTPDIVPTFENINVVPALSFSVSLNPPPVSVPPLLITTAPAGWSCVNVTLCVLSIVTKSPATGTAPPDQVLVAFQSSVMAELIYNI